MSESDIRARAEASGQGFWERIAAAEETEKIRSKPQIEQCYDYILKGDGKALISALTGNPILVNLVFQYNPDTPSATTLLISTIIQISRLTNEMVKLEPSKTRKEKERQINSLLEAVGYMIQIREFNLQKTDQDGNTALHRIFWYAILMQDSTISQQLIDLGLKIIDRVAGSKTMFRSLLNQKNKYNESFYDNVYSKAQKTLEPQQQENMQRLQKQIAVKLSQYENKDSRSETYHFTDSKSFKKAMKEILLDGITQVLMKNPMVDPTSGHTFDAETWSTLPGRKHPLTREVVDITRLERNKSIQTLTQIYTLYSKDPDRLFIEMQRYMAENPYTLVEKIFVTNFKLKDAYDLIEQYAAYRLTQGIPTDVVQTVAESPATPAAAANSSAAAVAAQTESPAKPAAKPVVSTILSSAAAAIAASSDSLRSPVNISDEPATNLAAQSAFSAAAEPLVAPAASPASSSATSAALNIPVETYLIYISETILRAARQYHAKVKSRQTEPGTNLVLSLETYNADNAKDSGWQNKLWNTLTTEEFLEVLIRTKKSHYIPGESSNACHGDGSDWNQEELTLLNGVLPAIPCQAFDDGAWLAPNIFSEPLDISLLFASGVMLLPHNPDFKIAIKEGALNKQAYKGLYIERLLPLLLYANATSGPEGAFVSFPGIGCGQFAGRYVFISKKDNTPTHGWIYAKTGVPADMPDEDVIPNPNAISLSAYFGDVLQEILTEYASLLPNIKGVYYGDAKKESTVSIPGSNMDFICNHRLEADGLTPHPGHQAQFTRAGDFGVKYKNCKQYCFVAADLVSYPGNDFLGARTKSPKTNTIRFLKGARRTDEGVKGAATNVLKAITGMNGQYNPGFEATKPEYTAPYIYQSWDECITENRIRLKVVGRLMVTNERGEMYRLNGESLEAIQITQADTSTIGASTASAAASSAAKPAPSVHSTTMPALSGLFVAAHPATPPAVVDRVKIAILSSPSVPEVASRIEADGYEISHLKSSDIKDDSQISKDTSAIVLCVHIEDAEKFNKLLDFISTKSPELPVFLMVVGLRLSSSPLAAVPQGYGWIMQNVLVRCGHRFKDADASAELNASTLKTFLMEVEEKIKQKKQPSP